MDAVDYRPKNLHPALIQLATTFVQEAVRIPGVIRVALVGSITTTKTNPKDVDLWVTIEDTADLTPLAIIGRRLKGKTGSLGSGADIFLATPRGTYIGRICEWRDCWPGVRIRCNALHCGRRHLLHDGFRSVRLSRELVGSPPEILWPKSKWAEPVPRTLLPLREMFPDRGVPPCPKTLVARNLTRTKGTGRDPHRG